MIQDKNDFISGVILTLVAIDIATYGVIGWLFGTRLAIATTIAITAGFIAGIVACSLLLTVWIGGSMDDDMRDL